jgi:hypothetical protein
MRSVVLALLLAGCAPTVRVEFAPREDPVAVVEWRKKISERVNDHDSRIDKLEVLHGRSDPAPAKQSLDDDTGHQNK